MAKSRSIGTKLHRETTPAGTWTRVAHIVDFDGWGGQTGEIDATDLDSTEAESEPDLADPGSASLTINVNLTTGAGLATYADLVADQIAGTKRRYALELPAAVGSDRFIMAQAYVSGSPIRGGRGSMIQSNFGLRLTGSRSFVAALPTS